MTHGGVETEVTGYALDVLAEWVAGYDAGEGMPQRRYTLLNIAEDLRSIDVRMETCDPFPGEPQDFRIRLEVEAL
ncbi:hypothetical protein NPS70_16370 [Streptomyces sp. C10-9-1]|uniref:hypothetical protein n=1 Tax=Streptomyces sp. C10-9-1 TaxID=1859285 RepID=UPI002112CC64|nr:hypothetical protein [Streptomyces sp. C10-9-1]MCQ6554761.1 hypothetical protein [Streptomyces sp. C10-9-1]